MIISKQLGEPMSKRTKSTFSLEFRCFGHGQSDFTINKTLALETIYQLNEFTINNAKPLFIFTAISVGVSELPNEAFRLKADDHELFKRLTLITDTSEQICKCVVDIQKFFTKALFYIKRHIT